MEVFERIQTEIDEAPVMLYMKGNAMFPQCGFSARVVQILSHMGVPFQTAHRRFGQWTGAGLWRRLHRAVLDELGARGELDWTSAIIDAASVRAKKGGR